jgi:hypothetical protein
MDNPERTDRHSHCHRDDYTRTCYYRDPLPLFYVSIHLRAGLMFLQLSRARVIGTRFTVFVMTRVVRLTIETNALTGTFSSNQPHFNVHLTRAATFELAWPSPVSYSKLPFLCV